MSLLLDIAPDELKELHEYVCVMLGGEDIDVDIIEREVKVSARRGLKVYEREVNQWQIRNQMPNIIGFKSSTDFTKRFVQDNQMLAQRMADWWAAMARVGGKIPWKKDYVELENGKQIYNLANDSSTPYTPGSRRIHKVLWYATPELLGTSFSPDLLLSNLWSFGQTGLSFAGNRLAYLGQVSDIVLLTQSFELRNKILYSEFYHNISGDILEITPMPGRGVQIGPGAKLFYYYFDEENYPTVGTDGETGNGNDPLSPDDQLIANPIQVKIDNIPYSSLNSPAKTWIDEWTLALCKYIQGSKWRKVKSIASPGQDYQVEFDYNSLLTESDGDRTKLLDELREELGKLDFQIMMQNKADMTENANKINRSSPRKFFIG